MGMDMMDMDMVDMMNMDMVNMDMVNMDMVNMDMVDVDMVDMDMIKVVISRTCLEPLVSSISIYCFGHSLSHITDIEFHIVTPNCHQQSGI